MREALAKALALAHAATRDRFARGGFGMSTALTRLPGTTPLAAPPSARGMLPGGAQPVLSQNLQHGLLRHVLRQRQRFDDGGNTGGGDGPGGGGGDNAGGNSGGNDNGPGNGGNSDGTGASSDPGGLGGYGSIGGGGSYGSSLGSIGVGAAAGSGGYGIGGFGGAVGSVSGGTSSDTTGGGFSSMGVSNDTAGSTMSNAVAGLGGLSSTGGGFSTGTSGGNIGPSGIATGAGFGNVSASDPNSLSSGYNSNAVAGFGNFGSGTLGGTDANDVTSGTYAGGLNSGSATYGLGTGSGYSAFGAATASQLGDTGTVGQGTPSSSPYGGLANVGFGSFGTSPTDGAGMANYGSLDTGAFSSDQSLADAAAALRAASDDPNSPAAVRSAMFGSFGGSSTADAGVSPANGFGAYGASDDPSIGAFKGLNGTLGLSSDATPGLGVLGGFAGFDNFGTSPGLSASLATTGGFTPNAANGYGSGLAAIGGFNSFNDAASKSSAPASTGLGGLAAAGPDSTSTDPGTVDGAPALTVHVSPSAQAFNAFGQADQGLIGNIGGYKPGTIGSIGSTLGTATTPGFDNFNQGDALTAGTLPGSQYTAKDWSPQQEQQTMVQNPGDYTDPAQYPGLAGYTGFNGLSPNFAKSFLGNAQAEAGPSLPTDAVNMTGYDTGLSQWTGARKTAMLASLGIDPGIKTNIPALKSALTPDTLTGQMMYGLNEIATQPTYAAVKNAWQNQNLSPQQQSYNVAMSYEAPKGITDDPTSVAARTELARRANFSANFAPGNAAATIAGLGNIGAGATATADTAPNAGLGSINTAGAPSTPAVDSVTNDVKNALAIAQGEGNLNTSYTDGLNSVQSFFHPDVASGEDSMDPDALAAQQESWRSPSTAMADAATMDANGIPAQEAAQVAAYQGTQPAATGDTPALTVTPGAQVASTIAAPTYSDPDAPVTSIPPHTDVTTTPGYFKGEQGALSAALNIAAGVAVPPLGLANTISGLLGGPTIGSFVTNHSQPGNPANPSGNSNSHQNVVAGNPTTNASAGGSSSTVPLNTAYTSTSAPSTATSAYLAAISHFTAPPAAKKANVTPLVAPGSVSTASLYNPLADPAVLDALAAARSYGSH